MSDDMEDSVRRTINLTGPPEGAVREIAKVKASIESLRDKTIRVRLRTVDDLVTAIALVVQIGRDGKVRDDLKQAAVKFGRPDLIPADWA